jgi:hypothetical protein
VTKQEAEEQARVADAAYGNFEMAVATAAVNQVTPDHVLMALRKNFGGVRWFWAPLIGELVLLPDGTIDVKPVPVAPPPPPVPVGAKPVVPVRPVPVAAPPPPPVAAPPPSE